MFEDVLLGRNNERRPWTLAMSVALQATAVGVLVLVPLIYTEALPLGALRAMPLPPSPRGRPDAVKLVPAPRQPRTPRVALDGRVAPAFIPRTIDMTPSPAAELSMADPLPPSLYVEGGTETGPLDNRLVQLLKRPVVQPPPTPPAPRPQQPTTVRRGGEVQEALLIFRPTPEYPPLARTARISGVVRLEAIISEQGTIEELRVTSGHPMLVEAALRAVRQWRYRPTYLNGQPVRVSTTIDVNFTLSH